MSDMNLPRPEFRQTETGTGATSVRVILRNNVKHRKFWIDTDVTRVLGESLTRNLSADEKSILNFVVVNGRINVSQCQRQVRSLKRWHAAKALLMSMVSRGLLEYHKPSAVERSQTFFTLPVLGASRGNRGQSQNSM